MLPSLAQQVAQMGHSVARGPHLSTPNFYKILSSRQSGSLPIYTTSDRPFANCFDGLQGVAKAYSAR